ncbi:MAG TPA: hypothetical protein VLS45_03300, partial [Methylomicrobium sp.]|nr:hypothetical protein [Methylomicrobium sp.]
MKRIGCICLSLFTFFLMISSSSLGWQETPLGSGNYVSEAPPAPNADLLAAGGSSVDVFSGHSVTAAGFGILLMTPSYTVTNSGTIVGALLGVTYIHNGMLMNYGNISGFIPVAFLGAEDAVVDNRGDIVGNTIGIFCGGGANVSLVNTGRIVSDGYGIYSAFAGDFRLDNRGDILGDLMGVNLSGSGSIDIFNSGSITGTTEYGIYVQSDNGNINLTNTGRITAIGAVGVGGSAANGNVALHNQGEISGSNDAVILGTSNGNVNITNTGRITATSNVMGAGVLALSYNGSIAFNNLGDIRGADGIDLIAQNGNITITNTGNIVATATSYISPSEWYGDGIYARATNGNIVLNNQGLISGTLYGVDLDWDSSNVQITNTGSIVASDIPNGIGVYAPTLGNLSL